MDKILEFITGSLSDIPVFGSAIGGSADLILGSLGDAGSTDS